jgi:hypothetical protein
MGVTTDNASNNFTFIEELSTANIFFEKEMHFRCFAHVINLSVQEALKELDTQLKQV